MICNLKEKMNSAIILAGGYGTRTNLKIPKQFVNINSQNYIVDYSIDVFRGVNEINEIILVCPKEWKKKLSKKYSDIKIVLGGKSRTMSSLNGLNACSEKAENVLIHDAARPFISPYLIKNIIENLKIFEAVIPIIDCVDSILEISNNSFNYLEREKIKYIQTPQGFKYHLITEAYKNINFNLSDFSDDFSIVSAHNKSDFNYKFINGESSNYKITTSNDIALAKKILK